MNLAERMDRILIESAFEVLVKARALEAQGRALFTWRSASPISRRPHTSSRPAKKALDEGWTHYGPTQGYPGLPRSHRAHMSARRAASPVGPEHVCVVPGGKPIIFFPMLALLEARRRGDLSESRASRSTNR